VALERFNLNLKEYLWALLKLLKESFTRSCNLSR
jgi:hypothetical protein